MAQQLPSPSSPHPPPVQSSSRLNRLLTLLDTGSTQQTRFAAARQIGDIARSHPHELNPLLRKVSQYLRSRKWDTRVAAAKAIGSIAENSKRVSVEQIVEIARKKVIEVCIDGFDDEFLLFKDYYKNDSSSVSLFRSFDVGKVLEFGVLLASGGQEYDLNDENNGKNSKERLARQKKNLRRRLGLDLCEQFMDVSDMIKDEDLVAFSTDNNNHNYGFNHVQNQIHGQIHSNVNSISHNQVVVSGGISKRKEGIPSFRSQRPSARELNLLKRKAKVNDVRCPVVVPAITPAAPPPAVVAGVVDSTTDDDGVEHEGEDNWPFHGFVEQLLVDMFDPVWELRHGSIMALREILTYQGAYAGVSMNESSSRRKGFGWVSEKLSVSVKREREIDLNMEVVEDESLKKPKLEGDVEQIPMQMGFKAEQNGESSCGQFKFGAGIGSLMVPSESHGLEVKSMIEGAEQVMMESNNVVEKKDVDVMMNIPKTVSENPEIMSVIGSARNSWLRNGEFLQDCAICFLCVLSLDRFGDYVSDQVVAPVRETCSQALGAVLKYMAPELVRETMNILLLMQERPEWEIRHGSLLGIKYMIAVRQEMMSDLLGFVLPACKAGLEDPDDDVRAVAADALIPAASTLVARMDHTLNSIVILLWDILLDLDDLSPSTSSVMNLLAELYSYAGMTGNLLDELSFDKGKQELDLNGVMSCNDDLGVSSRENPYVLSTLAPRLWPFMRHSITSVRYSAIRTLERLLDARYKRHVSQPSVSSFWPSSILGDTLRIVFQNLLLESNDDILLCTERVWKLLLHCPVMDLVSAAGCHISSWLELATTAYGSELDTSKMFWPVAPTHKSRVTASLKMRAVKQDDYAGRSGNLGAVKGAVPNDGGVDVSGTPFKIIVGADSEKSVTHTRVVSAAALGVLASKWPADSIHLIIDPLWKDVTSLSGVQRQVSSMVLISWFKEMKHGGDVLQPANGVNPALFDPFRSWLLDLLSCTDPSFPTKGSLLPYAELSRTYFKMRSEASHLFTTVQASGMFNELLSSTAPTLDNLGLDDAVNFATSIVLPSYDSTEGNPAEKIVFDDVESSRQRLLATAGYLKCVQANLHVTVSSLMAAAVVWFSDLPSKLNPIILPLMASLRREQEEILQQKTAEALAELIGGCIARKPGPNDKLIKNLCSLTCMDHNETPQAGIITSVEVMEEQDILSCRNASGNQKSRGRSVVSAEDRSRAEGFISRRGAELALKHLCKKFGPLLFDKIPKLWDCLTEILKPINPSDGTKIVMAIESVKDPQLLINNIQVVRSISPLLDEALNPKLLTLLPCIFRCVRHSHVAVRLAASRCITTMAKSIIVTVMASVVENVVPMLGDATSVPARHGAGILINLLVQGLGVELVPYAPLLVVPLLRCMSDSDASVRQSVTRSFAAIVPLLPLARGLPTPEGIQDDLLRDKEDAKFLEQLLDNSSIDDYTLHTELKVTLRRYQQEGINWLAFLKRFKLHGILCDDMGLGKTLQASAIVASDIVENRHLKDKGKQLPPSIIVCPSTLVGHWAYEIEKFIDPSVITSLQYLGSSEERVSLRSLFAKHNVIITSYDVVRKDVDFLGQCLWNYCILDEGHIIKNCRSKITAAVKQLKAQNRLILSGTPIQNNILDLWSLFDFLMPGFLGTERQFQSTYGKPLLAARDPKCSAKDAEGGALAMEALHKQVMPFLLRRTKDEVLSDLPEKIIQDRYCDLSPVQLKLYERFSTSHVKKEISGIVSLDDSTDTTKDTNVAPKASSHIFQALQYLLKLCSHPLLVASDRAADTLRSILSDLIPGNPDIISELRNLHHSPKLIALQEILEECGIGVADAANSDMINVGQHRVLIFAQHKALLDIIERDLFRSQMKNVTYLRLDGSVPTEKRFEIVKAFNSDPTIDVLLLTTHVGGLGLNLTSADTLVFMEHDWNPMRDLQAMDRAHRLGQKKVVNVYRLIMRGTLEEKVMSLQRFKVSVANSVINAENASLKTMNTDQLLDLFTPADVSRKGMSKNYDGSSNENKKAGGSGKGLKAILTNLDDLWDQSQYTEEYNLDQFLSKLNG